MALDLFYGNAVSGSQRFPRPDREADMLRKLTHTAGIRMFGLRRIGKSTMTLFAQEAMAREGYAVVKVDAQGMRSLDGLLFGVFSGLPKQGNSLLGRITQWAGSDKGLPQALRTVLPKLLTGIGSDPGEAASITHYWPTISAQIVQALREDGTRMLLTIDELPYLLEKMLDDEKQGAQQVNGLLASLREWRAAGMKMVLTGSIGMAGLARQHGFSTDHINDLSDFALPELSEAEASSFVAAATAGKSGGRWTEAHTAALLREAGVLYPCFLVKGLLAIDLASPPPPEAFGEIFATRVRPELHDSFLSQFNRRFKQYRKLPGDALRQGIVPILQQVMRAKSGSSGQPALVAAVAAPFDAMDAADFLAILQEDGFLQYSVTADEGREWAPASRLVTLWWKQAGL